MSQEIWFKNDIKHVLMGIELANAHLASRIITDEAWLAYREGFRAAVAAAALSFGLHPSEFLHGQPCGPSQPPAVSIVEPEFPRLSVSETSQG